MNSGATLNILNSDLSLSTCQTLSLNVWCLNVPPMMGKKEKRNGCLGVEGKGMQNPVHLEHASIQNISNYKWQPGNIVTTATVTAK